MLEDCRGPSQMQFYRNIKGFLSFIIYYILVRPLGNYRSVSRIRL